MRPSDFRVKLSTGEWLIIQRPLAGLTAYSSVILLAPDKSPKEYMNTAVHEGLHATNAALSEAEVERMAGDLTEILWKMGYRLTSKRQPKP